MLSLTYNVSVIIPVYNAEPFLEKAVKSALDQMEVREVILVEDGSTDGSLKLCQKLAEAYEKIKLLTHPANKNKGAGYSRNFGIVEANSEFIAFLDADDYYLPGRFRAEMAILSTDPRADGVYGAQGFHYYSEEGKRKYLDAGYKNLTTVSGNVPPEELFHVLMGMHVKYCGNFHLNTLTLRKDTLLKKRQLFNSLEFHEDIIFSLQLSLTSNLLPGIIGEPISMRGVHATNRIVNRPPRSNSMVLRWEYLHKWAKKKKRPDLIFLFRLHLLREKVLVSGKGKGLIILLYTLMADPKFCFRNNFFDPCCLYIFGHRWGWAILNKRTKLKRKLLSKA